MKKLFVVAMVSLSFLLVSNLSAFEISFRNGPSFDVKNWPIDTQYKLGINFAGTSKGAKSGFCSSTSIDLSLLRSTTIIWLTPEFQFDIKLGGLPLYIYPKLGLDMIFGWWPGSVKSFGFGIKPAFGAKFDLMEKIFIWAEPFGLNIMFAQYFWGGSGLAGFASGVWTTTASVTYDLMFGIGFRL